MLAHPTLVFYRNDFAMIAEKSGGEGTNSGETEYAGKKNQCGRNRQVRIWGGKRGENTSAEHQRIFDTPRSKGRRSSSMGRG